MMIVKRLVLAGFWATFALGVAGLPAAADDPAPAPKAVGVDPGAVQSFGGENPTCLEWSDACFVCRRAEDGSSNCSTAGIACTPQVIVCRKRKD